FCIYEASTSQHAQVRIQLVVRLPHRLWRNPTTPCLVTAHTLCCCFTSGSHNNAFLYSNDKARAATLPKVGTVSHSRGSERIHSDFDYSFEDFTTLVALTTNPGTMPGAGAGNGHLEGSRKSSSDQDLYAFLADCELEHYYTAMVHSLKVTGVAQLKYVEDPDLASIGLTNPEMRRLRKQFRLRCPQSAVDRLRLRLARARGLQPRQRPSATPEAEFSRVSSRNSRLIPRYQLQLGRQIGEGDFARVHQAVWRPTGDRGLWL
uniref:non-specific protein-tyrosine kinase n=1 Tax=Macrostomum lignano TaxID=282301 RepID=A0A1I8JCM7_9PLAT